MTNVFDRLAPYGYAHHRALNDFAAFEQAIRHVGAYPEKNQVLEGDLCWNLSRGRQDFYFRHPSYFVDALSPAEIDRQRREGTLVTLDDLIERDAPRMHYVIEIKVGRGDEREALSAVIEKLQRTCKDRFWLDGFSLRLMQMAKSIDASVATSVHTERVTETHVWLDAPEWPPFRRLALGDVQGVDAIAIRKRFSDAHMARASAAVRAHGFTLLMSRLFTLGDYERSRQWGARVGYPKLAFEDIVRADAERERGESPVAASA